MKLVSVVWKIPSYLWYTMAISLLSEFVYFYSNRSMMNIGVSSITGASDARNDGTSVTSVTYSMCLVYKISCL